MEHLKLMFYRTFWFYNVAMHAGQNGKQCRPDQTALLSLHYLPRPVCPNIQMVDFYGNYYIVHAKFLSLWLLLNYFYWAAGCIWAIKGINWLYNELCWYTANSTDCCEWPNIVLIDLMYIVISLLNGVLLQRLCSFRRNFLFLMKVRPGANSFL